MTHQDLLFASLMGVSVGELNDYKDLQTRLDRRVAVPIPFLPFQEQTKVPALEKINPFEAWQTQDAIGEEQQYFPLSFSFTPNGQKWTFPYEPLLAISSGNNVVMRNVAKQGKELVGTVKERWSRKDFDITITGVLVGKLLKGTPEDSYPKAQLIKLFEFLTHHKEIYVYSYPLLTLGITKVVITDYDFPFSKGENVQAYSIKCVSDFSYNLLIERDV